MRGFSGATRDLRRTSDRHTPIERCSTFRGQVLAAGTLVCGLHLGASAGPLAAQGGSGGDRVPASECCPTLLLTVGARALGLGDAITARTSPSSVFANPATLAGVDGDEFLVHNTRTSLEQSNTFTLLIRSAVAGTFALSYRLVDHGEQEARDPNGNPTGRIGVFEQVLTASYATGVIGGVNAGINYKLYQFRQDCSGFCGTENFSATTHGVDIGVQVRPPRIEALELGASVVHLGFPLQVINAGQASPMPTRIRVGAAYEVAHHFAPDTTAAAWLVVDVVASPRDAAQSLLNVGAEFSLDRTLFLWLGYAGGTGLTGGASVGVGLVYDRFDVGVAKSFLSSPIDDSEPLQVTFGIRF